MLHVIVHSSLNVSREQLTDLPFAFHFIPYICFRCFFCRCFIWIAQNCVCFFSFVFCCVCLAGSMRILFYLHYTIFFIFYVALSFHSCSIFFIHTAVLVHRFYGAKFIFTAYIHTRIEHCGSYF